MKKSAFTEFVQRKVWTPLWKHEQSARLEYCRMGVHDGGRSVGQHQCSRKATEVVEGYGFCKQHADEMRSDYGIRDTKNETILYAAKFSSDGNHVITKLYLSKRTSSTITISAVELVIGGTTHHRGTEKINSEWNRRYTYLDTEKEAWEFLLERSLSHHDWLEKSLEESNKDIKALNNLIQKEVWNRHS